MTQENTASSYGEFEWDQIPDQQKDKNKNQKNKPGFLKFKSGNNPLRIFTKRAHMAAFHKVQMGPNMTTNFKCSDPIHKKDCPFCEMGIDIRYHAYVGAISRVSNRAHIAELRPGLIKKIQILRRSAPIWKELDSFDMNVVVDDSGDVSNYYNAFPIMPGPLSAEDLELIKEFDEERLSFYCSPPKREKLVEWIRAAEEKFGAKVEKIQNTNSAEKAEKQVKTTKASTLEQSQEVEVPEFPAV